ncbi:hypothetical protein ACFW7J_11320 [Streptomyces sp. NPDC059525]|uniref:hypothetical protein n=1 Tax=Streptomyces sp. NPDC059525 TaxID=3346857 RepID=UPI0036BDCFB9
MTARYTRLSDTAATTEDRAAWWEKVMALRNTKRAVSATDRAELIDHIRRWTATLGELRDGRA